MWHCIFNPCTAPSAGWAHPPLIGPGRKAISWYIGIIHAIGYPHGPSYSMKVWTPHPKKDINQNLGSRFKYKQDRLTTCFKTCRTGSLFWRVGRGSKQTERQDWWWVGANYEALPNNCKNLWKQKSSNLAWFLCCLDSFPRMHVQNILRFGGKLNVKLNGRFLGKTSLTKNFQTCFRGGGIKMVELILKTLL